MTEYTISTEHIYPNITIHKRVTDGVHTGFQVSTDEGYVMCDPNEQNTELDPETMKERPVTYYYTLKILPPKFNFSAFPWVAVPVEDVDEKYVFGSITRCGGEIE